MAVLKKATGSERTAAGGILGLLARQNPGAAATLSGMKGAVADPRTELLASQDQVGDTIKKYAPAVAGTILTMNPGIGASIGAAAGKVASSIPGLGKIAQAGKAVLNSSAGQAVKNLIPSGLKSGVGQTIRDTVMGGKPITLGNVGSQIGSAAKAVGGAIKDHPEYALAAAQGAYGVSRAGAADDARKQALKIASSSWDQRDPLRRAGVAGMLNTTRPSLPEFSDPTNPFAQGSTASPGSVPAGVDPALLMRGKKRPLSMRY